MDFFSLTFSCYFFFFLFFYTVMRRDLPPCFICSWSVLRRRLEQSRHHYATVSSCSVTIRRTGQYSIIASDIKVLLPLIVRTMIVNLTRIMNIAWPNTTTGRKSRGGHGDIPSFFNRVLRWNVTRVYHHHHHYRRVLFPYTNLLHIIFTMLLVDNILRVFHFYK